MEKQLNELNASVNDLNRRLGVVISLLLRTSPQDGALNLKGQITLLDNLGMRPRDIAEVLGKTPTHITKELAGIRKDKKKKP